MQETPDKDTKSALLNAAERLFLYRGFDGTSVREITDAAEANVAAVNYHFGSKTNLYREVLARRFAEITSRKVELLSELRQQPTATTLREVVSTYIRSYFDDILTPPDGERLLQIIYREMGPDALASDLVRTALVRPIHQALFKTIEELCPDLSEKHISRCISSITGQVLHFIRAREFIKLVTGPENGTGYIDEVIQHITEFSLRGIGSSRHV